MATTEAIPGYTVRRPTQDDIPAVTALLRECELADFGLQFSNEEDMRVVFSLRDLERDLWLVDDESGEPAAYAAVRARHPTDVAAYAGVRPSHRGRGIGTHLLPLTESRAREEIEKAPPEARVVVGQWIGPHADAARTLLERHGYRHVRTFWEMEIELDSEPPEPVLDDGLRLETFVAGNERAVFDALEEAFRDHWGHTPADYEQWRGWNVEREDFDPSLWLLVLEGDEIAGASVNTIREGVGWVNVLGVRRPWRKRGIGLALLHASFREFRRRGITKSALGVDAESPTGATRLYERAGMHVERSSYTYQKVLREGVELYAVPE